MVANAIQALSSQGVAETTNTKAFEELLSRHPFHPPPSVSIDPKPALVFQYESAVLSCLKAFPKGTSPGWSRLRAQYLLVLDAIVGTTAPSSHDCLAALTKFMNLLLLGKAPSCLAPWLCALTALFKKSGGVRRIAIGEVLASPTG